MRIRNLLGNRYRGQIGKSVIASSWKGRHYVKAYAVPRNPRTERQQENRQKFGGAKDAWRRLTEEERSELERRAQAERISGWNLFVREYMAAFQGPDAPPEKRGRKAIGRTPSIAPPDTQPSGKPSGKSRRIRDVLGIR